MIEGILLAAGRSRRMGTQKLLLPWGQGTVVSHIVDQLLESSLSHVRVVVGHDADRLRAALADRPVSWVINPEPEGDMLSSVRCGLRVVSPDCAAALVVLGDQPRIARDLVDDLLGAFEDTLRPIVVPLCRDRRGHPLLIARRYFEEVSSRYDGIGLCGLLREREADVYECRVSSPGVLSDMDTALDYQRELRRAADPEEDPS